MSENEHSPHTEIESEELIKFSKIDDTILNKYTKQDQRRLHEIYSEMLTKSTIRTLTTYSDTYGTNPKGHKPRVYDIKEGALDEAGQKMAIELMSGQARELMSIAEEQLRLEKSASTDELTGLYKKEAFGLRYEMERKRLEKAEKNNEVSAMVFIDLDHFRMINEKYGHTEANKILAKIGEKLKTASSDTKGILRPADVACRFGGDELALLLTHIQKDQVQNALQRIFLELTSISIPIGGQEQEKLSFSMGVRLLESGVRENLTSENIIKQADDAAYTTKRNGRRGITYIEDINEKGEMKGTTHHMNDKGEWEIIEGKIAEESNEDKTVESRIKDIESALQRVLGCVYIKLDGKLTKEMDLGIRTLAQNIHNVCTSKDDLTKMVK